MLCVEVMEFWSGESVMVTGGCGFIGSHLVMHVLRHCPTLRVVNVDAMQYNSRKPSVDKECIQRYTHVELDLSKDDILTVLRAHKVTLVMHLAAQTHVDRSFGNSVQFSHDNVVGTHRLLESVREYGGVKRLFHMSTDEVYGEVFEHVKEVARMNPTNPYAATKCAAEHLVSAYAHAYGLNMVIARCNNVYGSQQFPDKIVPLFTMQLLRGEPCSIHGSGEARRHFLHVEDCCRAIICIAEHGRSHEVYNIASEDEVTVNEMYRLLYALVQPSLSAAEMSMTVEDRPFNDQRYHINSEKLSELGWRPRVSLKQGLESTVDWYRCNGDTYWPAKKLSSLSSIGGALQFVEDVSTGRAGWMLALLRYALCLVMGLVIGSGLSLSTTEL